MTETSVLSTRSILLIISGGIAAYKSLELIRLFRKTGTYVRVILTKGGEQFVTPLSVSALSEHPVYTDLWSLKDESEMGHIRLSREADLIIVAPASANLIAKMANGITDDLASTTLLASNKPIMISPAMNPEMWAKPSTQRNLEILKQDGIHIIAPNVGDMACGETGTGRMPEATELFKAAEDFFLNNQPLAAKTAIVTSGPTYEPIDPVRFIGNRSSGKQGHAIAAELAKQGVNVTLVTGPVSIPAPHGVKTIAIETAEDMKLAVTNALPADIFVGAAAVADWRVETPSVQKMKKRVGQTAPELKFTENPDILATVSTHPNRPSLVIGFAAETEDVLNYARAKLVKKGCDWIVANQVGKDANPVFGADDNQVTLITRTTTENWPSASKTDVAKMLVNKIVEDLKDEQQQLSRSTAK
ncbi:MAG: bifunctional phosphopantothenoylcysteine decarboxylase/phosphopantothenate synthase [Alphaproteobacteria bacterium RIFCSPHIGHO2_02_FULL_46_13]|nr:MAG: bifunctional phosphopantothenoylcysteine decarboxylase/phosphopantothenate synthase [Alphaproteobacteria bacterium RIFCSPHIGHO2_02_FULL_46_13]